MEVSLLVDRTSGYEVLAADLGPSKLVGVIYDPRSTSSPVPWSTECQHCSRGLEALRPEGRHLPIQVKRILHALSSRRHAGYVPQLRAHVYEYLVPSTGLPHRLRVWRSGRVVRAAAVKHGTGAEVLRVTRNNEDLETTREGDLAAFARCLSLDRFMHLVASAVPADPREALAVLRPLAAQRSRHWNASECNKIDWDEVCEHLTKMTGGEA